jgi:hypothetical protein
MLSNIRLARKKFAKDKHSSLLWHSIDDEENTSFNIDTEITHTHTHIHTHTSTHV